MPVIGPQPVSISAQSRRSSRLESRRSVESGQWIAVQLHLDWLGFVSLFLVQVLQERGDPNGNHAANTLAISTVEPLERGVNFSAIRVHLGNGVRPIWGVLRFQLLERRIRFSLPAQRPISGGQSGESRAFIGFLLCFGQGLIRAAKE